MAFTYAGSLIGPGAPIVRRMMASEDLYVGQMVQVGTVGHTGGAVQVADAAGSVICDTTPLVGFVSAVATSPVYDSTYKGDKGTFDTTMATVLANDPPGPCMVDVTLCLPGITLIRGPLYNAALGTAITELTVDTADATGLTVTHAGSTAIDYADSVNAVIYCRKGPNRGQYRYINVGATGANSTHVAFTYGITVGDVFVSAPFGIGIGRLQLPATADYIDASGLTNYFDVFCHEVNLEEKGKEYAIFTLCASCSAFGGSISFLAG